MSCSINNTTTCTTGTITTTAGNLLVANNAFCCAASNSMVDSDSKVNTWNAAVDGGGTNTVVSQQYVKGCANCGSGHTFTATNAATIFGWLTVVEISGADASNPLDQTSASSETNTSHSSGSTATTTVASEILVGVGTITNVGVFTIGGSFTEREHQDCCPAPFQGTLVGTQVVAATGAYAFTYTTDTNIQAGSAISTWKASSTSRQRCIGCGTDKKVIGDR